MPGYYDLMLLVDPTAPEERRNAAISEAESIINSGGELVNSYDWGTRRMAYEIDHRPEADYRLYQFNGDNALLDRLNQRLRILDGVLRFRIIKLKPGQPTPPPPDQQAPRRRDERDVQDTKVAARAAADAPPQDEGEEGAGAEVSEPVAAPSEPAASSLRAGRRSLGAGRRSPGRRRVALARLLGRRRPAPVCNGFAKEAAL